MSMVPGSFDEQPSNVSVAGLRDRATTLAVTGRVFTRHQPHIGHQFAGRAEAATRLHLTPGPSQIHAAQPGVRPLP